MADAIIRLCRKLIIDSRTEEEPLKQLYSYLNYELQELKHSYRFASWSRIPEENKVFIQKTASNFGDNILNRFGRKMQAMRYFSEEEKKLSIEGCKTEVIDFNENDDSLIIRYSVISQKVILVRAFGDFLLLSKEMEENKINGVEAFTDLFTLRLSDLLSIIEFQEI